jgi:hypothetical protein
MVFPVDAAPGPVLPAWVTHAWEIESLSTLSDGDPVSSWVDIIAGASLTATTTARPAYIANAGDPYLLFDGTSDYLTAAAISSAQPNSIFVMVSDAPTGRYSTFFDGISSRNHVYQLSGRNYIFAGTIVNVRAERNARRLIGGVFNGATSIYVDGAENIACNPSTASLSGLRIGANNGVSGLMEGRIRAVYLALGHAATLGELAAMQAYVVEKYGAVA